LLKRLGRSREALNTVKEQERRALAAATEMNVDAADLDPALEQHAFLPAFSRGAS